MHFTERRSFQDNQSSQDTSRVSKLYITFPNWDSSFGWSNQCQSLLELRWLREVIFPPHSRRRMINAFQQISSLFRIEISASVEIISDCSLKNCWLKERTFPTDGCLRILGGFEGSGSLSRLEIPASVEVMRSLSSTQSYSLPEVVLAPDSRIRKLTDFPVCESAPKLEFKVVFPSRICHFSRKVKVAWLSAPGKVNSHCFSKFMMIPICH
jgi:hypothetical protein